MSMRLGSRGISLGRFVTSDSEQASYAPALSTLVQEMAFAVKLIAREIRRAALVGKLGLVGEQNPTGDSQKKLDVYSNGVVVDALRDTELVAAIVSEEMEELHVVSCADSADYILCVDPLDGSSNTDVNGALGTIFSFYRRAERGPCSDVENELRGNAKLAAAGYVLYGPSTVFVFSMGERVDGFTLDHDLGEFLLSHESIRCPETGRYFSANLGHYHDWPAGTRQFADHLIQPDSGSGRPYSLRYSGALVADLHRTLVSGGVYFYPETDSSPAGKLRLLYECAPLAFVSEAAGGRASSGMHRVLELTLQSLHQRTSFVAGSQEDVQRYEAFLRSDPGTTGLAGHGDE